MTLTRGFDFWVIILNMELVLMKLSTEEQVSKFILCEDSLGGLLNCRFSMRLFFQKNYDPAHLYGNLCLFLDSPDAASPWHTL